MLKIPWKHKSLVELPTLSIDKLRQNPEYLCKKAPLLPTPLPERGDSSQPTTMDSFRITKNPPFPPYCQAPRMKQPCPINPISDYQTFRCGFAARQRRNHHFSNSTPQKTRVLNPRHITKSTTDRVVV